MPAHHPALPQRLERLVEGAQELTTARQLPEVLQRITDLARQVTGARYAAIGLLGPDGRTIETFVTSGLEPEVVARVGPPPTGRGVLGTVIRTGQTIRLEDIAAHPDAVGFPPGHPIMKTFLGVPVRGRSGTLGNLYLTDKVDGSPFTDEDEYLVTLLAGTAASAVENARAHETAARLLNEVQVLLRSRERFFAMVNHELRNAIAAVYGWAELLIRRKTDSELPRAAVEILESAQSAVTLINDLLDLSRLDEDRLRPVVRWVDLIPVLREAVHKMTPSASAKRVAVTLEGPAEGLLCHTDAHRVEQIVINLLSNAIRHTPEASQVRVSAEDHGATIHIMVTDEGPGIPPEDAERIFDIYHSRAGAQGVGLGLPLSLRLARLLGGDLIARNRPFPSTGACFALSLPRDQQEQNSVKSSS